MATESKGILTKADILRGKDRREIVYLSQYDKNVVVRPLTDGEVTEVFKLIGNVPSTPTGEIDLSKIDIYTNLKALRTIVSMALVEPKMTENEIAEMRFGTPGVIAKRVLEISGLTPTAGDEVKKFRSDE